jgi:hydrogenase maturation protease
MENYLRHESAESNASHRIAVVGLGNPLQGDDGVGLIVAQSVFAILRHEHGVDLLDCSVPDARLAERLIGYRRAVIVDALIDAPAKVGTVKRVEIARHFDRPSLSLHTSGFQNILALAQMVGIAIPRQIQIYGIVIRQPRIYCEGLSRELGSKIPEVVRAIAAEELRCARKLDCAESFHTPRAKRAEECAEMVKGPP